MKTLKRETNNPATLVPVEAVTRHIYLVRGHKVMLDTDLVSAEDRKHRRGGLGCSGHLADRHQHPDDVEMWRREEPVLDRETLDGIIRLLMEMNAKLNILLGGEEDGDAWEHES